ncbi:hypothetical protein EDD85DRAFT_741207, partial [Armillaria nabsnona]
GERLQTRKHILHECKQYEDRRHLLRAVSRDICLLDILGTKDEIVALATFLEEFEAFTKTGRSREPRQRPTMSEE